MLVSDVFESSLRSTTLECRYAKRNSEHHHHDNGSKSGEQKPSVKVEVEHAADRQDPGKVKIKYHYTVEEPLVDTWIRDVCHRGELLHGDWSRERHVRERKRVKRHASKHSIRGSFVG